MEKEEFQDRLEYLNEREKALLDIFVKHDGEAIQRDILNELIDRNLAGKGTAGSLRNIKASINRQVHPDLLPEGNGDGDYRYHQVNYQYYNWVKEWNGK